MLRRLSVLLAAGWLVSGAAGAAEITFQESEVDVGQSASAATPIDGDEWLSFGIDMNGGDLLIYGPPNVDPFLPLTDNNGVFEASAASFEIVFVSPVTQLEIDWWTQSIPPPPSTITVYGPGGEFVEQRANPGVPPFETESFGSAVIARVVIEAEPQTLCVANLRWEEPAAVPAAAVAGLLALGLALFAALAVLPRWRSRRRGAAPSPCQ